MKRNSSRLLSSLLVLCMVLALLPGTALAAEEDLVIENGVLIDYKGEGGDVVIPDSVTVIGDNAFFGSSVTSVIIPDSVTTIEQQAFNMCRELTSVTFPNTITVFPTGLFMNCMSLPSVTIPDGVTTIESSAFFSCRELTSVTIPASVTSIDFSAFWTCSKLTDVYYAGTESQWEQIDISDVYNESLFEATIHYNSTGPEASETPEATPEAPDATPEAPDATPEAPDATPEAPDATPEAPEDTPSTTKAVASKQELMVDGVNVDCEKYNIGGYNYFKLRDLACILSGSDAQFDVDFEGSTVLITTGQDYALAGDGVGEYENKSATARPSTQTITIDEVEYDLTAYNIHGYNFFQLRDLGDVLGFEVDFDAESNTALIKTVEE